MPFGKRRSSILAWQRCLALLRRLLRGPAGRDELLAAVHLALGEEAYPQGAHRALEYDLHCLRAHWGVVLAYERPSTTYRLVELPFALLDLPDDDLTTLAFLYQSFSPAAPHGPAVRALLDRLVSFLPDERRRQMLRLRTIPELELQVLDQEDVPPAVWAAVEQAVVQRRQLTFTYRPAQRHEGEPLDRQHRVEPYVVELHEGHYYLEGYCLRLRLGTQERTHVGVLRYRLSRIVPGTVQVLPDKIPPGRRPARTYTIRYRLAPAIARGGVTPRFPQTKVRRFDDGSAEVEAEVANLWQARRVLLRYGEHCLALAPEELVGLMRHTVAQMATGYGLTGIGG